MPVRRSIHGVRAASCVISFRRDRAADFPHDGDRQMIITEGDSPASRGA